MSNKRKLDFEKVSNAKRICNRDDSKKQRSFVTDRIIIRLTDTKSTEKDKKELLELIENHKDEININKIHNGNTILMLAIEKYPEVAVKIIREYGTVCSPGACDLILACRMNSYDLVCELINKFGQYVNFKEVVTKDLSEIDRQNLDFVTLTDQRYVEGKRCYPGGAYTITNSIFGNPTNTALIEACKINSYKIVSKLVESFGDECNPGAYNNSFDTALHIACSRGNEKIAMLLLDKFGEKCNVKQKGGLTGCRTALKWCDGNAIFKYKPLEFDMRKVAFKILNYYTYKDGKRISVHNIETALKAFEKSINDEKFIDVEEEDFDHFTIRQILKRIVIMLTLNYKEYHWNKPNNDLDISKLNELSYKDGTKVYSTDKYGHKQSIWLIEHVIEVFEKAVNIGDDKIKNIMEEFIIKYVNFYNEN